MKILAFVTTISVECGFLYLDPESAEKVLNGSESLDPQLGYEYGYEYNESDDGGFGSYESQLANYYDLLDSFTVFTDREFDRSKILGDGDKNREDLIRMLDHYNKAWPIDSNYITNYGCNCVNNLDRDAPSLGNAVDRLDLACKNWHQCMKCAKDRHGNDCSSTEFKYQATYVAEIEEFQCLNGRSLCRRSICECDLQFAKSTALYGVEWSEEFWSESSFRKFDENRDCQIPQYDASFFEGECCNNPATGHLQYYNKNVHCCENDGVLLLKGACETNSTSENEEDSNPNAINIYAPNGSMADAHNRHVNGPRKDPVTGRRRRGAFPRPRLVLELENSENSGRIMDSLQESFNDFSDKWIFNPTTNDDEDDDEKLSFA